MKIKNWYKMTTKQLNNAGLRWGKIDIDALAEDLRLNSHYEDMLEVQNGFEYWMTKNLSNSQISLVRALYGEELVDYRTCPELYENEILGRTVKENEDDLDEAIFKIEDSFTDMNYLGHLMRSDCNFGYCYCDGNRLGYEDGDSRMLPHYHKDSDKYTEEQIAFNNSFYCRLWEKLSKIIGLDTYTCYRLRHPAAYWQIANRVAESFGPEIGELVRYALMGSADGWFDKDGKIFGLDVEDDGLFYENVWRGCLDKLADYVKAEDILGGINDFVDNYKTRGYDEDVAAATFILSVHDSYEDFEDDDEDESDAYEENRYS